MEDKLHLYRQPLVTVTGILLGFILNFASNWVTKAFKSDGIKDILISIGLCICCTLLLIVLYRILRMNYPKEKAETYYRRTLHLFIAGISLAFCTIILVMIETYILNR